MRIVFLSLAVKDLASIRSYIAADNPEAARMVGDALSEPLRERLRKLIQGLAAVPNMVKAGRVFGTRELVTPKIGKTPYIVVYRVREDRL